MSSFVARRRVLYRECDMQGWVFHSNYVGWLDDSLLELWGASVGPYTRFSAAGNEYVVANLSMDFRAGARFEEEIDVEIILDSLGRTSLGAAFEIRHGERLLVEASVRVVCIGPDGKIPWPDEVRAALVPFLREST